MIDYLTGPQLRDRLKRRMSDAGMYGHVHYKYANPPYGAPVSWANIKAAPEYEAEYIRAVAYRVNMGGSLDELHEMVRAEPGCVATRVVQGHATLRPQVQAIVRRGDTETTGPVVSSAGAST